MQDLSRRRFGTRLVAAGAAAVSATAVTTAAVLPGLAHAGTDSDPNHDSRYDDDDLRPGRVYTSTNAAAGNELLVFAPARDGSLALVQRVSTGGLGSGAGLGSQGAVTLSGDGRHLFVVNAGSNTVSTFALGRNGAVLASAVDAGGLGPTSVTEHDGRVYVLNAGGNGNVAGFRLRRGGELQPLADGIRPLSAAGGTAPAQVGFGLDGEVLVVTERNTNRLSSWRVRRDGSLGAIVGTPSSGPTPFGFAFNRRDHLIVSEAFGGAAGASAVSSYRFDERSPDVPRLVSGSVPTTQTAACWIAVSADGRTAYAGNAGSNSVSSYRIARDGRLTLAQAVAGSTGANAGVTDLAIPPGGRRVYVLAPRGQRIAAFRPGADGMLEALGAASGLPAGCAGLAAD